MKHPKRNRSAMELITLCQAITCSVAVCEFVRHECGPSQQLFTALDDIDNLLSDMGDRLDAMRSDYQRKARN